MIQRLLETAYKSVQQLGKAILSRHIDHVVIAARGTSDNASIYAKCILGAINGLIVSLATPSLYTIYQRPPQFGNALLLAISQSGKSLDIVAVAAEARRQGVLTAVITNSPGSDVAKESDFIVDLNTGEEKSVAATKTYTAELASIVLLSAVMAPDKMLLDELRAIPEAVAATLSMNEEITYVAPRYRYMKRCVVIGRGYNYATACEMALKMNELTYSVVQPYSSADFLHGPIALIENGFPVIVIAPSGKMESVMETFVQELNKKMAEVIAISDVASVLQRSKILLPLPHSVPEWLSPLTTIIPGQLLSLHLAHERGFDVDSPRSLKKVTETH